jgi:Raf kinase inhibitor-like YbhB/YbcL family protein
MALALHSPAFENGGPIPTEHTADWDNTSPPLHWAGLPPETSQLALIMDDPDAPTEQPFVHWVVFAIPRERGGLPEGLPNDPQLYNLGGLAQGVNDYGEIGYYGPDPPVGSGRHRYRLELFALDRPVQLEPKVNHEALRAAMAGTILERAMLTGTYQRMAERV